MKTKIKTYASFIFFILIITSCNKNKIAAPIISGTAKPIVLISPRNSLVTPNKNQSFTWTIQSGDNRYELKIASPSFNDMIILDTFVTTSTVSLLMQPGYYEWCVNSLNPNSTPSYSDTSTLTIH